ncbi:MAG: hypothetical protein C1O27_000266 [Chloroflexi bacterium]|nr:MAG: hypothetical protein C1O27_000266 [Chloroflexota bacterium]
MHGKELVELIWPYQALFGAGELKAHQHSFQAANEEENERRYAIQNANAFVVNRSDPRPHAVEAGGAAQR